MAATVTPSGATSATTGSIAELCEEAKKCWDVDAIGLNPEHSALHARINDMLTELGL